MRKVSRKLSEPPPNSPRSPPSVRNPSVSNSNSIAKHLLTLRTGPLISSSSSIRSLIRSKKRLIERSQTSANPSKKQIQAPTRMKTRIRTLRAARYHLHISSRKGMVVLHGRLLKRTLSSSGLWSTSPGSKMIEPP